MVIEESTSGAITSLSGLSQLIGIKGNLELKNCHDLVSALGLNHILFTDGSIRIENNPNLMDLGLEDLYRIGDLLSISQNDSLQNLNSLSNLHSIGNYLSISDNAHLSNIDGLRLLNAEAIHSTDTSHADIELIDNSQLNDCDILSICQLVNNGNQTYTFNNKGSACSGSVVIQNCKLLYTNCGIDTIYYEGTPNTEYPTFGLHGVIEQNWMAVTALNYRNNFNRWDLDVLFYKLDNGVWNLIQTMPFILGDLFINVDSMNSTDDGLIVSLAIEESGGGPYNTEVFIVTPNSDFTNWTAQSVYYDLYGEDAPPADIDDDYAIIAENHQMLILQKVNGTWTNSSSISGVSHNHVAISGEFICSSGGNASKLYKRSGNSWSLDQTFANNGFVDMKTDKLLISNSSSITAYLFNGTSWVVGDPIPFPSGLSLNFDHDQVIDSNRILLSGWNSIIQMSVVYHYENIGSSWLIQDTFTDFTSATAPSPYTFGSSVSLSGKTGLITDPFDDWGSSLPGPYELGDLVIINCLDTTYYLPPPPKSPCPSEDLVFESQGQIDSFIILYPQCTQIAGNLKIKESSMPNQITNLQGLTNIKYTNGNMVIQNNSGLVSLSDMSNLVYVNGNFTIFSNDLLSSVSLPALKSVDGEYAIVQNPVLLEVNNQSQFTHIDATLNCYNNALLNDITGLAWLDPTYIQSNNPLRDDYEIHGNPDLAKCSIYSVCTGLNDELHTSDIRDNKEGCLNEEDVRGNCLPLILGYKLPATA